MIGTTLSHFKLTDKLGEGGMGAVYRATDTKLGRDVAIKVLPGAVASDPERLARFEREAKALAAISHPHIVAIHEVRNVEGVPFLVMELAEGRTLQERIALGPIPVSEALTTASQIASALQAAHEHGIIHRDLKPANAVLTRSGPKLLDFGLAKLFATDAAPTATEADTTLTRQGEILGTPQYMAPEQLEGKTVDARTDLFAFGALLFEMITGRKAFDGSTPASLIASILRSTPDPMSHFVPGVPAALERLVSVCLAKEPENRWSSMHDVRLQLEGLSGISETKPSALPRRDLRERALWAALSATLLVALGLAALLLGGTTSAPRTPAGLQLLSIVAPDDAKMARGEAPQVALDGDRVVFVATDRSGRSSLYVRDLDGLGARALAGTDDATLPFWAPDGQRLGFFANGQLKTIAVAGGTPQTIASAPVPRGGSWSRDDVIIFVAVPSQPPYRVAAIGGDVAPVPMREAASEFRWFPTFLPDGRHYLYLALNRADRKGLAIHVASLDSEESKELVATRASAAYASPGYLLYRRETSLVAQRFDPHTLTLEGAPVSVAEDVGFNAITYQALFSASERMIVYEDLNPSSELVWFDRNGKRLGPVTTAGDYNTFCISSDGDKIIHDLADSVTSSVDLWALDIASGISSRLTFDPAVDFYPVCSPTGAEIIFSTLRGGAPNLFRQSIAAPGTETTLLPSPAPMIATDWSRDGGMVVYSVLSPTTNFDVAILTLSTGESSSFAASNAEERNARLSPDGRFIAYVSNESGKFEVYVQRIAASGGKWQVSRDGGLQPQWQQDGRRLFYLTPDSTLVGVDVSSAASDFGLGEERTVLKADIVGWERYSQGSQYAVMSNGDRFLVNTATDIPRVIHVALDWPTAVAARSAVTTNGN